MRPDRGEVAQALLRAAAHGPGTVTALARRAQVGLPTARYTASRLIGRGDLVVLEPGRPAILATPDALPMAPAGAALADALDALYRCWWGRPID